MAAHISAWIPEPADLDGAPAEIDLHAITPRRRAVAGEPLANVVADGY